MTDTAPVKSAPEPLTQPEEPSIGTLVATISSDLSTLLQHEIALVKSEVKISAKNGGLAAGLFAAAGFLLVLAVICLAAMILPAVRRTREVAFEE